MTFRVIVTVVATALAVGAASAEPVQCTIADCQVGRTVWSASASGGTYFVCPTAELSEYVNSVLGLISLANSVGSPLPEPSPITGEPSYTGETKAFLDTLRHGAGVRTLDEAVAQCRKGRHNQSLVVKEKIRRSIYVTSKKAPRETFWMPASSADLRQ